MRALLRLHTPAAACALAASAALASSASSEPSAAGRPLFRFGVIADIQYCDCDDASNFAGTEIRKYRGTLEQTRRAVEHWNALREPSAACILNLGDIIDGQNAGGYGAGLTFDGPQSEAALGRVCGALSACKAPIYHAVGNHELYNFDWAGLRARLQMPEAGSVVTEGGSDAAGADAAAALRPVSWQPCKGWTFVLLNAYAVSMEQPRALPIYRAAAELLQRHNPSCYEAVVAGKSGVNFFAGIEDPRLLRYVPFNGGLGEAQLAWLREEVRAAVARDDRIVVLSHLPMYEPAASARTLLYDADEALALLQAEGGGRVVAVLAGHLHRGGYAADESGIHHVTLQSPLNYRDSFGHVDVHADRLELIGAPGGEFISRTLPFPAKAARCPASAL